MNRFSRPSAQFFVPDGLDPQAAIRRTTHLAVAAHPDDTEIMAVHGILECYQNPQSWFTAVILSDGAGSPRRGKYLEYSDEQMRLVRREEQIEAARIGGYGAVVLLDHPSTALKDPANLDPVDDLVFLLEAARPSIVYTHNPADRHPTHVATALRTIAALRRLPVGLLPEKVYGCEVWRDLDWLSQDDRLVLDVSAHPELQRRLLVVFDSQIAGGKRYDLAAPGRRRAHATFSASHALDQSEGAVFALDLTPLIADPKIDIREFMLAKIDRFAHQVGGPLERYFVQPD